jgi:hypothetical protein
MEDNTLEQIVDTLVDGVVLITSDIKKMAAIETTRSYGKAMLAVATAVPVYIALSSTPTISQERMREPETQSHIPSQSQGLVMLESQVAAASTGGGGSSTSGPPPIGQRRAALEIILASWYPELTVAQHLIQPRFLGFMGGLRST